jgi:small subunit ribosomal protein S21
VAGDRRRCPGRPWEPLSRPLPARSDSEVSLDTLRIIDLAFRQLGAFSGQAVTTKISATRGWTFLAEIKVQEGESIENALRRFKRKVQQEDIIKDIKKHSFYMKPGDKRRAKQALARKRNRKKIRREAE